MKSYTIWQRERVSGNISRLTEPLTDNVDPGGKSVFAMCEQWNKERIEAGDFTLVYFVKVKDEK